MATRSLVGSCLFGLLAAGTAAAQVVLLSPPMPVLIPAPLPVLVEAPPPVEMGAPPPTTAAQPKPDDQRHYPPATQTERPRRTSPAIIHERHYLSPNMNVSHYLSTQPAPTYGPETMVVIRDFYITDEPPKKGDSPPPPVGAADDKSKAPVVPAPRNSAGGDPGEVLSGNRPNPSGVNVPNPSAADNPRNNGNSGGSATKGNYPPGGGEIGPPAPPNLLDPETTVTLASRNGGTPMADLELNFVDLAGKHADVKSRTDGKGQLQMRLAPTRWQVYAVVGDNERRSLGIILVKPTPGEPFKLQF